MKALGKLFSLVLLSAGLVGCETTGDPTRGGIFWSENKAQQRLQDKQSSLSAIQSDTSRVNRRNATMEDAAARRRRYLGE